MRTILVTGGCGFIGSHFVRLLLERTGWRVVNLDKLTYAGHPENLADITAGPAYRFVRGDIGDRELVDQLFRNERPWGVVNFAAESHVDRSILNSAPFLATNIGGLQVLLEGAKSHGVERFLQVSTDEVYGNAADGPPFTEESPLTPSSPYAATKAAADLLALAYARTHGLPVVITRSSNNYGPYQFPEKLIPLLIRNALAGKPLPLYGDGLQRRDWLYVGDNVEAIHTVLEHGHNHAIYNVAAGEDRTNLEVVQAICRLLAEREGTDPATLLARICRVEDRPAHDRRYALDTRRLGEQLGWVPRVSFETGLDRTLRWYLEHQEWIDRVTSGDYRQYYEAVYTRSWERSP